MMLPKHIYASIEHNPHALNYQSIDKWLEQVDDERGYVSMTPKDRAEIQRTGEVWVMQWYPNTPVGFHCHGAPTLARLLEIASGIEPASGTVEVAT